MLLKPHVAAIPSLLAPGTGFVEDCFYMDQARGWSGDDSSGLGLSCALFLLLLHQLHLRSSGIRSWGGEPLLYRTSYRTAPHPRTTKQRGQHLKSHRQTHHSEQPEWK